MLTRIKWPLGQAVKTPPSQGGIMGSIPVGVTKQNEIKNYFYIAINPINIQLGNRKGGKVNNPVDC